MDTAAKGKCPVTHTGTVKNQSWWPEQLNLKMLHQGAVNPNPMDADFDYAAAFNSLDLDQVMDCLLYTSPSPRDQRGSRMPSSA